MFMFMSSTHPYFTSQYLPNSLPESHQHTPEMHSNHISLSSCPAWTVPCGSGHCPGYTMPMITRSLVIYGVNSYDLGSIHICIAIYSVPPNKFVECPFNTPVLLLSNAHQPDTLLTLKSKVILPLKQFAIMPHSSKHVLKCRHAQSAIPTYT